MSECACGCKQELTGKQTKWKSAEHKNAFNTRARRIAAGRIQAVLASAVSTDAAPTTALFKKRNGMHVGSLETSKAQKAILERLEQGPATTLELHKCSGSMAVSTDVSALNKNLLGSGRQVLCQYKGTFNGRKVYEYTLVKV